MGTRYFLALFLIFLVLGFEVQGIHVPQEEETARPALLTKVQESLLGYWDVAKAAAQKLYKKTYLPAMDEKIRLKRLLRGVAEALLRVTVAGRSGKA
ncbi:Apolipoprotein C-II, partial [Eschrichtius robustus]|nr:Apolipoprotein C-II [Eschrichtius robustus]